MNLMRLRGLWLIRARVRVLKPTDNGLERLNVTCKSAWNKVQHGELFGSRVGILPSSASHLYASYIAFILRGGEDEEINY